MPYAQGGLCCFLTRVYSSSYSLWCPFSSSLALITMVIIIHAIICVLSSPLLDHKFRKDRDQVCLVHRLAHSKFSIKIYKWMNEQMPTCSFGIDLQVTGCCCDLQFDAHLGLCLLREEPRPNPPIPFLAFCLTLGSCWHAVYVEKTPIHLTGRCV